MVDILAAESESGNRFSCRERLTSISNRLRFLNPVSTVLQFLSVYPIQKAQIVLGFVTDHHILHTNTHTTLTLQFCDMSLVKAFLLPPLNSSIWGLVSDSICIKLFWAGVTDPGPISWLQSQRRNPASSESCHIPGIWHAISVLREQSGSFLWGYLSRFLIP